MGKASLLEDIRDKIDEQLQDLSLRASASPSTISMRTVREAERLRADAVELLAQIRRIRDACWRDLDLATDPEVDLAMENAALRRRCDELTVLGIEREAKRKVREQLREVDRQRASSADENRRFNQALVRTLRGNAGSPRHIVGAFN